MNIGGMFVTACEFANASDMMKASDALLTPCMVNAAFACELYIKGLLVLQGFNLKDPKKLHPKDRHSLSVLFALLNDSTKDELKRAVLQKYNAAESNFETYMDNISNVFYGWRYRYEEEEVFYEATDAETFKISYVMAGGGVYKEFLEALMSCLRDLSFQTI